MANPLTLHDLVLIAASTLPEEFHGNDLAVACWHKYPSKFALKGHPGHVDVNKVIVALSGKHGLPKAGLLHAHGNKRYSLTELGRQRVEQLSGGVAPPHSRLCKPATTLTQPQTDFLQRIYASPIWDQWRSSLLSQWRWADVVAMWGDVESESVLASIASVVAKADAALPDGRSVGAEDVRVLMEMDRVLRVKFKGHIGVMKRRVG